MPAIFTDIENELSDIAKEVDLLVRAIEFQDSPQFSDDPAWRWLTTQGLASGIEKIYTGCERVMAMIASDIDREPIEHGEGWHSRLLKRVAYPFPGIRDAVLSEAGHAALDQLRSFRHRERNSYGLMLDAQIVSERARVTKAVFELFRSEVRSFLQRLNER